jgi:hypothetical protein
LDVLDVNDAVAAYGEDHIDLAFYLLVEDLTEAGPLGMAFLRVEAASSELLAMVGSENTVLF